MIVAEQGHVGDFWGFQPEAHQRLLTSFYDTGTADTSLYKYLSMDFKPTMRFPLLAKILRGMGGLLILGLGLAIGRIIRRCKAAPAGKS